MAIPDSTRRHEFEGWTEDDWNREYGYVPDWWNDVDTGNAGSNADNNWGNTTTTVNPGATGGGGDWTDIDKKNEETHNRLRGLQSSADATTYDAAKQQYQSYIESIGGRWSPEVQNDFENMWRQSAEASRFGGAGLDYANLFTPNFESQKGRLVQRWQGEAGQDSTGAGGPTSQYTGGGGTGGGGTGGGGTGTGGSGDAALAAFIQMLQDKEKAAAAHQATLRGMLLEQLGELGDDVSLDDPGIREAVRANRNALQRGSEAQRRESAERRAYDESGGVGSRGYMTDVDRIQQQAGENAANFEGQIMFTEMQARREELNGLLAQAMALGDADTARLIQTELSAINSQLQQSNFYDTLGFNYAKMQQDWNQWYMDWLNPRENRVI